MRILILIFILLLAACGTDPKSPKPEYLGFPNNAYEAAYYETEACTGLTAYPPGVIIVSRNMWQFGDQYIGFYYINRQLALIKDTTSYDPILTAKHEYTHHLLSVNNGDISHDSPLFDKCSYGSGQTQ